MKKTSFLGGLMAVPLISAVGASLPLTEAWAQGSATLYVAPNGSAGGSGASCSTAAYNNIQTAVSAAPAGATVVVCSGSYKGSVTITQLLTLVGKKGAVLNAKGQPYAIGIAHSGVTVSGMTVEGATANEKTDAPGDGIVTAGFVGKNPVTSNNDIIVDDVARDNQGAGIDLNSTTGSIASDDTATGNGVGINLSNDLGLPSAHNRVVGNTTNDNPGGCGIALADHSGVGVFDNSIIGNVSMDNGLGTPSRPSASSGSGIILAGGGKKGGVWGNTVQGNWLSGNGHAGVAFHVHAKGMDFSGNKVVGNTIGANNLRTDYKDLFTTGIYIGDGSPLNVEVSGNVFQGDHIGIFTAGTVTVSGEGSNAWLSVTEPTAQYPTYGG